MVGACVTDYAFIIFLTAERRGHFAPSQKSPQRKLHDYAYFLCKWVFVFVCFLFHIPPIAGASGVGGGIIIPGCENMSIKDFLELMDGS